MGALASLAERSVEPAVATVAPAPAGPSCEAKGSATACGLPPSTAVIAAALPTGKPAMIEFMSQGCAICRRMAPVVESAIKRCSSDGVAVAVLDVSGSGALDEARKWGVRGVPTFLFVDAGGHEVARLVGEQPQALLEQSLAVLTGRRCDGFRALPPTVPGT